MINFLDEAEKLIAIRSISKDGNEQISVYLQDLMRRMGFKTVLQEVSHSVENVSKHQFNSIGMVGDSLVDFSTKKGLLLTSHIDTAPPGIRPQWTETSTDPFQLTINEDKVFGLGAADAKLDLLCKLKACEKYMNRRLKMPIYVVATAAEEIGMLGAKFLIKSMAVNPKYILVGKPTNLKIAHIEKTQVVYEVVIAYSQKERDAKGYNTRVELKVTGRSSHTSSPDSGESAILKLLNILGKINQANFQLRITKLDGGEPFSKIPDVATVEFFVPTSSFDDFRKFFKQELSDSGAQVEFGGLGETGLKFMPENALVALDQVLSSLAFLQTDFLSATDNDFQPPKSTTSLSRLESDRDCLRLTFDIHLLPDVDAETFDQKIKYAIQNLNTRFPSLTLRASRKRILPGIHYTPDNPLLQSFGEVLKMITKESTIPLAKSSFCSEASSYRLAGYDALTFGPGTILNNSHAPNEHCLVSHLDKAVHFYDQMIEKFCL